ncbi:IclR family transcriptional regulator [Halostagnicola bangensis]
MERSSHILEYLRQHGPSTISELESSVDISAGTIHTYLASWKDHGFVEQDGTTYRLGSMFIPFGVRVRNENEVYQSSKTVIKELAHDVGGCVHLMTIYRQRLLILEEVYGKAAIGLDFHTKKRGKLQHHVHCTAGGKAILAHLPDDEVAQLLDDHGLPPRTSNTITDRDQLLAELADVREQGHARNDQEHMPGVRAVGAPIRKDDEDGVLGTVSISGPAASWTDDIFMNEIPTKVIETANAIEIDIHSRERTE